MALRSTLLALVVLLAIGCMPTTPRLTVDQYGRGEDRGTHGYRFQNVARDGDTLLLLALSGGGTRAAAFSYGVLQGLHDAHLTGGRTLVDEIDGISSVSGGSFTSAYLALFGQERFFARFPEDVLHRKIETGFALRILNPLNWPRLLSPWYGRGDLAATYYDTAIFERKKFKDLPKTAPFVSLNATDIARGAQFSFTQDHFDRLCADLSEVPIGRAVAASSAFPIVFSPLTLENREKSTCGYVAPRWVDEAEAGDFEKTPMRWDLARTWRSYQDPSIRHYIHLSDGGLSDNIGLRAIEAGFTTDSWGLHQRINDPALKRVVVIVVDAKPRSPSCLDRTAHPSSIASVLAASTTTPMENYSSDTIERFRQWFDDEWTRNLEQFKQTRAGCDRMATEQCGHAPSCVAVKRRACYAELGVSFDLAGDPNLALHLVDIRFDAVDDVAVRQKLLGIGTRLQLSDEEVQLLVTWGKRLLCRSPEYQKVLQEVHASPCTEPSGVR